MSEIRLYQIAIPNVPIPIRVRYDPVPKDWGIFDPKSFDKTTIQRCSKCANCGVREDKVNKVYVDWHHITPRSIAWQDGLSEAATASAENCVGLCHKPECHERFNHLAYDERRSIQEVLISEGRQDDLRARRVPHGLINGRRFVF